MKISEVFNLEKTQHELDFIDIDIDKDKSLFIDPFFLSTRTHPWCIDASRTIKSFFQFAIDLIKNKQLDEAKNIFSYLHEPNETCLGMSTNEPRGRGVGNDDSERIFNSLIESKAVETGLVEDLEDTAIFIEGIDKDKVSDMTTNIIRKHLLKYTEDQCNLWGIPLEQDVPSGFFWDSNSLRWDTKYTKRLVVNDKVLLLVPKMAVSFWRDYTNQKYYQHDILNFLQGEHLKNKSGLVRQRKLKDGTVNEYVTKKDIKERDTPYSKEFLRKFTKSHPEIFEEFRKKTGSKVKPIENQDLENINLNDLIDRLIEKLNEIPSGPENANKYHKLMLGILELIFYPNLTNPIKEREINQGRKRVDITFDNSAMSGFFKLLHSTQQIPSSYIFVECKNYSEDPKNPEIDQLAGRFSVNNGKFGILVCRSINDIKLFKERCRDLWIQKNELIIPITDIEVKKFLDAIKLGQSHSEEIYLTNSQRDIKLS